MDNGSNATLNVTPSIDAIGEVRVLTSNYGAQYGRNASGTIETETKSGTRAFHGDAYEFVRNDLFNATPAFQTSVPSYKKNDWGYTIGGPVYIPNVYNTKKDKLFLLVVRVVSDRVPGQNFNLLVPSVVNVRVISVTSSGKNTAKIVRIPPPAANNQVPVDPHPHRYWA
jgi:hypothetical protein